MNQGRVALGSISAVALALIACSSAQSDASSAGSVTTSDAGAHDGDAKANEGDANGNENPDASDVSDANANDGAVDAAIDLSCLGESATLTLNNGLPYASVAVGNPSATGYFLVDFATTRSTIDLSRLPSVSSQATGCNPALLGEACTFPAFDFFGPWGSVTLDTDDETDVSGIKQSGIVGTDFTGDVIVTVDYANTLLHRALPGALCADATLTAAGFAPLSTAGFFAKDTTTLEPLTDVISTAAAGQHVPDVPTVPIRVAGASGVVQLDTGFDDALVPFSVNVNVAFYNAIVAASPTALVRNANKDLVLTTCANVDENVEAYDLAAGVSVAFTDTNKKDAGKTSSATIFVKKTPAAAASCGGIGTWTAPAAQVGASFFASRTIVFDPTTSRVWFR